MMRLTGKKSQKINDHIKMRFELLEVCVNET